MPKDAIEFWIEPDCRAACAVYAVAIGQHLGMDLESLRRIRLGVKNSALSGAEDIDSVLLFIDGLNRQNTLGRFPIPERVTNQGRLAEAYFAVAPIIQPLPSSPEQA